MSTEIVLVLDRSGSMSTVRDATIAGVNEFVEGQKGTDGKMTLVQFDSDDPYEVVYEDRDVAEAPKLTAKTFVPRGGTPLHDAIGRAIDSLGAKLDKRTQKPSGVVFVIMTDGLENASHEYTRPRIAEMIKHQKKKYNWQFIFLAANQDAILTGEKLNINAANTMTYTGTAKGTSSALRSTATNVRNYGITGQSVSLLYSEQQRKEATEDENEDPIPGP